jgi:adenylate kinase family enzyme
VEKRLEEYRTYTAHSIEIFRRHGTLIDVDGAATPEVVRGHIFAYLTNTA